MENVDHLNKYELLELKRDINNRLKEIKDDEIDVTNRKNNVKNKTKISQLTQKDRMFGIGFGLDNGGEYLKVLDTKWSVHLIDYCDVTEFTEKSKRDSEYHRFGVSHKTKPFGISTSLTDEEVDKHYMLSINSSSSGYGGFYTLFPETWEKDIVEALEERISWRNENFEKDINKLKRKIKLVIDNKETINKNICGK